MKVKISIGFWICIASFSGAVSMFILSILNSTTVRPWCDTWYLGVLPAITAIAVISSLRSQIKKSLLKDLLSVGVLILSYCIALGMAQIMAESTVRFFTTTPFIETMKAIITGIGEEFQTIFYFAATMTGRMAPPKDGLALTPPFSFLAAMLCLLALSGIRNTWKLIRKSTTKK